MTNPDILSQARRPISEIMHGIGQYVLDALRPEAADAILAKTNPKAFMLRPGDAVTVNIGNHCNDSCVPDYRVVVTNPIFNNNESAVVIGVQTPHFDTSTEYIDVALKLTDGTWKSSMRVLSKVDVTDPESEIPSEESEIF